MDYSESLAAKEYFSYYHGGFNRRIEDPINRRLNYGYAIDIGSTCGNAIDEKIELDDEWSQGNGNSVIPNAKDWFKGKTTTEVTDAAD